MGSVLVRVGAFALPSGLLKRGKVQIGKFSARHKLWIFVAVADHLTFSTCLNRHLPRTRDKRAKGFHFRNDRYWRKAVIR